MDLRSLSLVGMLYLAATAGAAGDTPVQTETVRLAGKSLTVDDALFTGCFHNAFEGTVLNPQPDVFKAGQQGVTRTKGVLTGAGSTTSTMTLAFTLERVPADGARLRAKGLADRPDVPSPVAVALNGTTLAEAIIFPANRCAAAGLNERYFMGWEERVVVIPPGTLRAGQNSLTLSNTRDLFAADRWPYAVIDEVTFDLDEPIEMTVERREWPPLYYGLSEGIEVNVWPAVNQGNRISLVAGATIEVNFFITLPRNKPMGKFGPLAAEAPRPKREILLHLVTDADLRMQAVDGGEIAAKNAAEGREYTIPVTRLVDFETPHPAQGARVFLLAGSPFADKRLTVWCSVDGVAERRRVYPLRAVEIAPVPGREALPFLLSLWGANAPAEPEGLERYVRLLRSAGFNHQFTDDRQDVNRALKTAGFQVYPRYGWFGRQFKVADANRRYAAVDAEGKASANDFCPLAILDHPDDAEMGKFFARAARLAALPDINGLCVDYETAPVWCWCDRCLDLFRKETGTPVEARADLARNGPHADAYADFGRRLNRRLLGKVKEVMLARNPVLQYHCLASASDLPTYWYDGRAGGRHSISELVQFADAIYASLYCYEIPGGFKSVIPVIETVRRMAVNSGRNVKANVITPVATTVSEFPRYRGVRLRPEMTRLVILLAGASGAGGVSLFRGDCMDGEQYLACRRAISDLVMLRPYLDGLNRSFEVDMTPVMDRRPLFETQVAQNLLARLVWRPDFSYQYDVIELLRDKTGRDRALLLFNYSDAAVPFRVKVRGLYDAAYALRDMTTDAALGRFRRVELETGGLTLTVPARDCLMVRLLAEEEKTP